MYEQSESAAGLTVDVRLLETLSWSKVEVSCHLQQKEERESRQILIRRATEGERENELQEERRNEK